MPLSKFVGIEMAVKNAISEKALELEGWKELLKNKTWEVSKPNITIAKDLLKPNITALKNVKEEIEDMFDPIEFVKGIKDAKKGMKAMDGADEHMMKDLKGELNDMYSLKKNWTHVEKLAKKEMVHSAEDKLTKLANLTDKAKDEAEEKLHDVKHGAYVKMEGLANVTAMAKDKVYDKLNMTMGMKGELKDGAKGKLAKLLNETAAFKSKFSKDSDHAE